MIRIRGARQNNLKNLDLDLPVGELIVVTGVSGSGKSSLVFDTLYAEGQRRYVETFSPYARQFLDRMDKPQVERIEGIPPSIAIDQTNPVRTSRSTVGTMTELNDHLKLLFARAATLHCRSCGKPVRRDTAETIRDSLTVRSREHGDPRLVLTFPVVIPENFSEAEVLALLERQGFTRVHARRERTLEVVQDRFRWSTADPSRRAEAIEAALRIGNGRIGVHALAEDGAERPPWRYSTGLHCADCDIEYKDPTPSDFSFNSPIGACPTCRGFGRTIGVDLALVIPDESLSLRDGAIKPWQTAAYAECQEDLLRFARKRAIPVDRPFRELSAEERRWVIEGEGDWSRKVWYGVSRFFAWLETKAYKMHIRVLLSRYRSYTECATCGGSRLKPDALLWRIGSPAMNVRELSLLPIERCLDFFAGLEPPPPHDEAAALLLAEIRARLRYLVEVGLGYLNLDRQSRTLSGGEVQRINLTTALGTSLVNTLFVLDEPSIGLHARDVDRIASVMRRLRDAGNTLVVVEHDPKIMAAADRVLDIGPGPGERGGEIVFFGPLARFAEARGSLTADYLFGRRRAALPEGATGPGASAAGVAALGIEGASQHNLRDVDVQFPLHRMVCVTGVSGSGKSTLVHDVLYRALLRAQGKPTDAPGAHRALRGAASIGEVVMIDQSPIGRTARSNPASFVGAFEAIRKRFAALPEARERKYTAGTFSFNAGTGRCPGCGGNGFEHVEMQFLSDVYLRCPDCDGRRYRREVLEIRLDVPGRDPLCIADVLDLTVSEALALFAEDAGICSGLQPLAEVGLEYLRLGQPVPTLSGGEAQRLKLAAHLAPRASPRGRAVRGDLFIFDEPTTGLHFDDIARLLGAFRRLVAAGHSLIVIEHNLDVIASADWIIDLGPEGGDRGGTVVACGTPAEIVANERSHTGRALAEARRPPPVVGVSERPRRTPPAEAISIRGAREHNLRAVDVDLARNRFTVVTGVSGSGKSTLAFDIVFAEGQRRYLESLNAYARQFVQPAARPDVDAIHGIPPTVAIEQRTSRGGRKSTVATLTEIYHFLRLLYVKLGVQHCPRCRVPIEPQSEAAIAARILRGRRGREVAIYAPLVTARKGLYTALAKWARGKGYAELRVDGRRLPTAKWPRLDRYVEHDVDLPILTLRVGPATEPELRSALAQALQHGRGVVIVEDAGRGKSASREILSTKRACPTCGTGFPELDPRLFSFNSRHGWCTECFGTGLELAGFDAEQTGEEPGWTEASAQCACPACAGRRLNPTALAVEFRGRSIADLTALTVDRFARAIVDLRLQDRELEIARDLRAELISRSEFLRSVGLGYLQLDRAAPTLSGGEAQRIRLAAQLGSNLQGVCYVLDEPTIGLHPRDNRALLDMLEALRTKGNTLIVVEHDEDTIRRADQVIDLGPGAGRNGGQVVAQGTAAELMRQPRSVTGRYLARPAAHARAPRRPVDRRTAAIEIEGARLHNLRDVDVRFPLGRFTVVTGVSGSGKSTLAREILLGNLQRMLPLDPRRGPIGPQGCERIRGLESITRVLEVDQTPIGKTPRSCPATYVGFWDAIRRLFAESTDARVRGFSASRFSFNAAGGRCERCEGQGVQRVEMNFLPDVRVLCDGCGGRRFNAETLQVAYRGRNVGEVLAMSVDEALEFFAAHRAIRHALALLADVGLGYLSLGQASPTLSGGESQRIKLVTELAKARPALDGADGGPGPRRRIRPHALYVLDEPTVGLHMADVDRLVSVVHRLVDSGNTVVAIEHNLDVMAEADWIVDLGPEGGAQGGRVVAAGPPRALARAAARGHTGRYLHEFLASRDA
ncbi:MAG: excinuclease ABC subunit UvrA [Gammaproteobacteria bacterium]|nr:excinuclease ABC subunit UvrA [Gammaproteobacteria bacterium]